MHSVVSVVQELFSPQGKPSSALHAPRHSAMLALQRPVGHDTVPAGQPSTAGHFPGCSTQVPSEHREGFPAGQASTLGQASRDAAQEPSLQRAGAVAGHAMIAGHSGSVAAQEPSAHCTSPVLQVILGQAEGLDAQLPPAHRKGVEGSHCSEPVRQSDGVDTQRPARDTPEAGHWKGLEGGQPEGHFSRLGAQAEDDGQRTRPAGQSTRGRQRASEMAHEPSAHRTGVSSPQTTEGLH